MPRPVFTTPEADADIRDAFAWYEARLPGLGADFLGEVAIVFSSLEAFPEGHAIIRGETRRAVLHRFPYSVFYVVDADSIAVTAVLHFRRDPRSWPASTDV